MFIGFQARLQKELESLIDTDIYAVRVLSYDNREIATFVGASLLASSDGASTCSYSIAEPLEEPTLPPVHHGEVIGIVTYGVWE